MPKVRKLTEVLQEYPEFKPGWKPVIEKLPDGTEIVTGIENPRFGKVERVVICDIYDQYQIEEGPADEHGKRPLSSGSVVVPYYMEGDEVYVGLIERIREVVIDPETREQGNYPSIELPRGFAKLGESDEETAVRELGEETSKVAKKICRLGRINPNTAFYVTPGIPAFVVEVDPEIESYLKPDAREPILKCEFKPYREVRKKIKTGEIYCGLSLSVLMEFDVFLEEKKLK